MFSFSSRLMFYQKKWVWPVLISPESSIRLRKSKQFLPKKTLSFQSLRKHYKRNKIVFLKIENPSFWDSQMPISTCCLCLSLPLPSFSLSISLSTPFYLYTSPVYLSNTPSLSLLYMLSLSRHFRSIYVRPDFFFNFSFHQGNSRGRKIYF